MGWPGVCVTAETVRFYGKGGVLNPARSKANAAQIYAALDELLQIDEVHEDLRRSSISVTYDASHHNIDEIITVVAQQGISVKDNWWSRARLGWQRQTDENIRANAKHEPFCCNKVPRR